jgi:hypothetical protein
MSDILPSTPHPHRTARLRAFLLLALLALVLLTGALLSYLSPSGTGTRIGVGDTLTLAKDRRVLSATMRDEDALVVGEARPGRGLLPQGGRFSAELPSNSQLTPALTALLAATGAQVRVDHQDGKDNARLLLTTLIPVLALTDLVWLVMLSPRNLRPTGTGWPSRGPRVAGEPAATAEVVVMSSNPTAAGADLPLEVVPARAVKSQGRKPGTAGRHLRTSGTSAGSGSAGAAGSAGSAGADDSADEEGEPRPARKRPAASAAKPAARKAPAAPAKASGKAPAPGARGGSGAVAQAKNARTSSPAKAPAPAKKAPRGAAPDKASGAVVSPRKRSPKGSAGS